MWKIAAVESDSFGRVPINHKTVFRHRRNPVPKHGFSVNAENRICTVRTILDSLFHNIYSSWHKSAENADGSSSGRPSSSSAWPYSTRA